MKRRIRFALGQRGSIMMLGAVLMPVALMAAAGAIDFTRTINTRADAQAALDATVMSLARMENREVDAQAHGESFFEQVLSGGRARTFDFTARFVNDGEIISGEVTVNTPTPLLGLFQSGKTDVQVAARAALPTGGGPLDLALVLDISASMLSDEAGGDASTSGMPSRFDNAIGAAKSMVEHVLEANPAGARIAIVPYGDPLRVPPDRYGSILEPTSLTGRPAPASAADAANVVAGERYGAAAYSDMSPFVAPFPFFSEHDSAPGYDDDDDYSGGIYGYAQSFLPQPLTGDRDTLIAFLDGLTSTGNTNGHIGFMWGWFAVSPNWRNYWNADDGRPLAYSENNRKAIVIFTDGIFNVPVRHDLASYETDSGGNSATAVISYFTKTCAKARQAGVEVYAIRYITGDVASLQDCANDPDRYFDAQSAAALAEAFKTAGTGVLGGEARPARLLN